MQPEESLNTNKDSRFQGTPRKCEKCEKSMSLKQDQCEQQQDFNTTIAKLKKEGFQNVY